MIDTSILFTKEGLEFCLRWLHILAGILWIGFLYWFNFVNVNFQKGLDAELKPKVNPGLILPTLFYFRWGAVVTVLSGLIYYISILHGEESSGPWTPLLIWLAVVGVTYVIMFNLIRPDGPLNNGNLRLGMAALLLP